MSDYDLTLSHVRVSKHWKTQALQFQVWRNATHTEPTRPLVYDHDESGDPKLFPSFDDAFKVCNVYEFGLSEDVREARWDNLTGEWEVIETFYRASRDEDREDFHADG